MASWNETLLFIAQNGRRMCTLRSRSLLLLWSQPRRSRSRTNRYRNYRPFASPRFPSEGGAASSGRPRQRAFRRHRPDHVELVLHLAPAVLELEREVRGTGRFRAAGRLLGFPEARQVSLPALREDGNLDQRALLGRLVPLQKARAFAEAVELDPHRSQVALAGLEGEAEDEVVDLLDLHRRSVFSLLGLGAVLPFGHCLRFQGARGLLICRLLLGNAPGEGAIGLLQLVELRAIVFSLTADGFEGLPAIRVFPLRRLLEHRAERVVRGGPRSHSEVLARRLAHVRADDVLEHLVAEAEIRAGRRCQHRREEDHPEPHRLPPASARPRRAPIPESRPRLKRKRLRLSAGPRRPA